MELVHKDLSYQITGACYEVNHTLGPGLLEKVYQEALALELQLRGIKVEREKRIPVNYKGHILDCEYIADMIVDDKVIIELKSVQSLDDAHRAQTINYLKLSGLQLAVLVNFHNPRVEIERFVNQ